MAAKRFAALFALFATAAARTNGLRGEAPASAFLGPLGRVDAGEVRASLQEALDSVLSGIANNHTERLTDIQTKLWPTYQALPKASEGRLGPRSVRHLLKSFFNKEHGWTLLGFDSTEDMAEVRQTENKTGILQAKVPALMESILEAREHGRGLTLSEVAALATALEHLIFDESVKLLTRSLELNTFSTSDKLHKTELIEVLISYLALFATVNKTVATTLTPERHISWKEKMFSHGKFRPERSFASDSIQNFEFARKGAVSPFTPPSYSFETSAKIVDRMAADYGRWQDESCKLMRDAFDSKDPDGSGRVSLSDFYSIKTPGFALTESKEQLRKLGMLDESLPDHPTVRTANYVLSSANCGEFSNYYHVCCMSGCSIIMSQLEAEFQAPSVALERLLKALRNISTTSDEDFHIATSPLLGFAGPALQQRLSLIAQRHGGEVPLHGRLFETWLHFAFPSDCPLPVKAEELESAPNTVEVMKEVAPQEWASDMDIYLPADEKQWSDADALQPLMEDLHPPASKSWREIDAMLPLLSGLREVPAAGVLRSAAQLLAMAGACLAFLRISLDHLEVLMGTIRAKRGGGTGRLKKDDDFLLPMRF